MKTLCVMTSGLIKCHISAFVARKDTKTRTAPQIGSGWRRKTREKKREKKAQKILRNLFGIAKKFCAAAPDTDPRTNSETETSDKTEALRLGRCLGGRWRDVWSRLRGATLSLPGHPEGSSPAHRRRPCSRSLISYRLRLLTLPGRFVILSRRHSGIFQGTAINQLTGFAIGQ